MQERLSLVNDGCAPLSYEHLVCACHPIAEPALAGMSKSAANFLLWLTHMMRSGGPAGDASNASEQQSE